MDRTHSSLLDDLALLKAMTFPVTDQNTVKTTEIIGSVKHKNSAPSIRSVIRTKRYELYSITGLQIIHKNAGFGKTRVVAGECEGEHEMGGASAREWRVMFQGER